MMIPAALSLSRSRFHTFSCASESAPFPPPLSLRPFPSAPLQIVPIAMASRAVAFKHTAAGLYSEFSYVLAVLAGHLPISIVCDVIFGTILYFIMGMAPNVTRWLVWVLIVFLMDLAISVMYRSFSYATPPQELAMIVSSLFTAVSWSPRARSLVAVEAL